MEKLICKCGSTEYYTELKANNNVARCSNCNAFIKNIPHDEPRLYVGKYKSVEISKIDDLPYLEWALKTLKVGKRTTQALEARINAIKFLAK